MPNFPRAPTSSPSPPPPAIEPNQRPLQHNALTQEAEVNTLTSSLENASLQEEFSQVEPPDWQATVRAILYSNEYSWLSQIVAAEDPVRTHAPTGPEPDFSAADACIATRQLFRIG